MRHLAILACVLALPRLAAADGWDEGDEFSPPPTFLMLSPSAGDVTPAAPTHAYQTSSRIAALDDGALVIDADSGDLLRVDAAGALIGEIAIGKDAGLLAFDDVARRAYVADRHGDRIVVVQIGERLTITRSWRTPTEPYAVALSPDRSTLLATMIADRVAVAYDAASGRELWRTSIDAEPRGIAISADGSRAAITSLTSSALGELALAGEHRYARRALPAQSSFDHARGAFAVTYLGDHTAVASYQIERPMPAAPDSSDHYGGSVTPPIDHELAFLGAHDRAAQALTDVHEPRAVAWDPARDALYVVGLASDNVIAVNHASQVDAQDGGEAQLGKRRCGGDGLAIGHNGQLLVWCSFSRQVARVAFADAAGKQLATPQLERGPELVASTLDATQHAGLELFHSANAHISSFGGMSCGNCHLEGRSDGQSWLIHGQQLQTPMLCGRITGTGPYKWDGTAPTLVMSLKQTMTRLGGDGLSRKDIASLAAYVDHMPPVRTPARDAAAVAHGKHLFESAELGCASCHDGPAYTDRETHTFDGSPQAFDTPSLLGLASTAPYFHDGSAATLDVVLRDRGRVHGMSDGAVSLSERDLADLKAFLESL